MTRAEAAEIVVTLAAAYPKAEVTAQTSQVYERMLADLDYGIAMMAVARLVANSRFLPTVAEIREAWADIRWGPRRTGAEAWQDVERAQRRVGYLRQPRFEDPIVSSIVSADWPAWCKPDNPAADRARFIELYEIRSSRARAEIVSGIQLPPPMVPKALAAGGASEDET